MTIRVRHWKIVEVTKKHARRRESPLPMIRECQEDIERKLHTENQISGMDEGLNNCDIEGTLGLRELGKKD